MSSFPRINHDTRFCRPWADEWLPLQYVARFVAEVIDGLAEEGSSGLGLPPALRQAHRADVSAGVEEFTASAEDAGYSRNFVLPAQIVSGILLAVSHGHFMMRSRSR